MNERIKELSNRAWEYVLVCDERYSKPATQLFDEKFAELIIQECLNIVDPRSDSGDEWDQALRSSAQEIREHFGIKQ
jgi:hypothetical protein